MKPSELKISVSVESYDEKTVENYQNCYVAEKRIISQLSNISIQPVSRIRLKFLYGEQVTVSRFNIFKPLYNI